MWADTILILVISVCTALLGEGVTWVLVYRTEKYQKLKTEIEKQTKKLEKKKEAHGETANLERSKKRKIEQDEEKLKNTNRDLTMVKMKSMFAIGWSSVQSNISLLTAPDCVRFCLHSAPLNVQLHL